MQKVLLFILVLCVTAPYADEFPKILIPTEESIKTSLLVQYAENGKVLDTNYDLKSGNPEDYFQGNVLLKSASSYEDGNGDLVHYGYSESKVKLEWLMPLKNNATFFVNMDLSQGEDILIAGSDLDIPESDSHKVKLEYATYAEGTNGIGLIFKYNVTESLSDNFSLRDNSLTKLKVLSDFSTNYFELTYRHHFDKNIMTLGMLLNQGEYDTTRFIEVIPTSGSGSGGMGAGGGSLSEYEIESLIWPEIESNEYSIFADYQMEINSRNKFNGKIIFSDYSSDALNTLLDPDGSALSAAQLYALYYSDLSSDQKDFSVGIRFKYEHELEKKYKYYISLHHMPEWGDVSQHYIAFNSDTASNRLVGNPNLDIEYHNKLEFGLKWIGITSRLLLDAFYDSVDNYIVRDRAHSQPGILLSDNAGIYRNINADLFGISSIYDYKWSSMWRSRFTFDYMYAQNLTDERPIAQTSPLAFSASLENKRNNWQRGGRLKSSLKQSKIDSDINTGSGLDVGKTPAYAVLDVYIKRNLNNQSYIELGINNIFDKAYAEHLNQINSFDPVQSQINEPGRSLWLKAKLEF